MRSIHRKITTPLLAALLLTPELAAAQPDNPRMYGQNAPFTVDQLPPGQLRSALKSLPPKAQARALHWLHSFDFPENDLEFLRVDPEGGVFYGDSYKPEAAIGEAELSPAATSAIDPNTTFMLHSKPGSSHILYLDFDGHLLENTAWNSGALTSYNAKPFDPNNNSGFDNDELARIAEIWHRVAEDMAPFDIDVTTADPIIFGPNVGRVLITSSQDANGNAMPYSSGGGVAYVGVWGKSNYASYYSPALVYYNNLANGFPTYVAEASTHEFGHNIGLSHDGTSTAGYFSGLGSDTNLVSWAPIMGVGYYKNVTQWSKGEYPDANNNQDDLALINADLGYRSDDHGDDQISASQLLVDSAGNLLVTNPQTDAFNDASDNKGIIERRSDIDMFFFDAGAGAVSFNITPAWDAFTRTTRRGANLDINAVLYDASGNEVTRSDPADNTDAHLSTTVPQGRYFLSINGINNLQTPYSDYGSLGMYFIQGTVTPASSTLNNSPLAAFSVSCTGLNCSFNDSSTDVDGNVVSWSWDFGDGSSALSQNPVHSYALGGSYSVTLTVTDNEAASSSKVVTLTLSDPSAQPPGTPAGISITNNDNGSASLSWSGVSDALSYAIQRESKHPKNGKWVSTSLLVSDLETSNYLDQSGSGIFRYSVKASNSYGESAWSSWSAEISVTDSSAGSGGGGGQKCNPRKSTCS